MDDLMARTMVENLCIGIDPLSGRALSPKDCCANELVQEALKTVLEHCSIDSYATILERQRREKKERQEAQKLQRAERYPSQGKSWTLAEDKKLRILCNSGYPIPHIANILKRSPGAVRARTKKLQEEA